MADFAGSAYPLFSLFFCGRLNMKSGRRRKLQAAPFLTSSPACLDEQLRKRRILYMCRLEPLYTARVKMRSGMRSNVGGTANAFVTHRLRHYLDRLATSFCRCANAAGGKKRSVTYGSCYCSFGYPDLACISSSLLLRRRRSLQEAVSTPTVRSVHSAVAWDQCGTLTFQTRPPATRLLG